jgi:hypothetical protein
MMYILVYNVQYILKSTVFAIYKEANLSLT